MSLPPDMKELSLKDFRALGYLQELNRIFLHPLGLALVVNVMDDDSVEFAGIWDAREDPEGILFQEGTCDPEKEVFVEAEYQKRMLVRDTDHGCFFGIQPVTPDVERD